MSRRLLTRYEKHGYQNGVAATETNKRATQCRVASVPMDSWRCRKHNRNIMRCLNERAEAERRYLLRLVHEAS